MNHRNIMRLSVSFVWLLFVAPGLSGAETTPPPGFKALFNGKDLSGWHGLGHFDPRRRAAIADEKRDQDQATFKAHWSIDNGELVNDGQGAYATTDEDYGDIELQID